MSSLASPTGLWVSPRKDNAQKPVGEARLDICTTLKFAKLLLRTDNNADSLKDIGVFIDIVDGQGRCNGDKSAK